MVLILAGYNLLGAVASVQRYTVLSSLPLSLPPACLLAAKAAWAVALGALAWGLWQQREWARRGTLAALTVYVAVGWAERLLLARSDYARVSLPFFLALHAAWLLLVWVTLLRRKVRQGFSA